MSSSTSETSLLPFLKRYRSSSSVSRHYRLYLMAFFLILFGILTTAFWNALLLRTPLRVFDSRPPPPSFTEFSREEEKLLQQNPNLASPEGESAKFLFSRNHVIGVGWGNVLQEMIWEAILAHMTKRAFVFDDYIWRRDVPYAVYNGRLIPPKIPAFALLSGPLVGLTLQHEPDIPRAVSRAYYEQQCPDPHVISTEEIQDSIPANTSGMTRLALWAKKINEIEEKCVELSGSTSHHRMFASTAILDVWPTYSSSPIVANLTYSPLALSAFQQNAHLLLSEHDRLRMKPTPVLTRSEIIDSLLLPQVSPLLGPRPRPEPHDTTLSALISTPPAPIPGLLAVHIRRGDYGSHCRYLMDHGVPFTAFNSFEGLPDTRWEAPVRFDFLVASPAGAEVEAYYAKRCFPTIEQIVEKVRKVREEYAAASMDNASISGGDDMQLRGGGKLSRMYIMTNGSPSWIKKLKAALYAGSGEGWEADGIVSSRDLEWGWEQNYVSHTTDMYIGQRAEVFIGNGFSSLSAHVVMMRMVDGKANITIRHW